MSGLPKDLLDLIEILQASLEEEWFGFVSDEIDDILEQPIGPRGRLFALRDVVRKLGVATPTWRTPPVMRSTGSKRQSRSICAPCSMLSRGRSSDHVRGNLGDDSTILVNRPASRRCFLFDISTFRELPKRGSVTPSLSFVEHRTLNMERPKGVERLERLERASVLWWNGWNKYILAPR